MEIKGSNIYVEASELPNLTQILPTDKILVQPVESSGLILFEDIILDTENTTFYGVVEQHTTDVPVLSSSVLSLSSSITNYSTLTSYTSTVNLVTLSGNNALNYIANQIDSVSDDLYDQYLTIVSSVSSFDRSPREWVIIDSNGSIIDSTPNIAGVVDSGSTQTINFLTPLPTTKYCVMVECENPNLLYCKVRTRTTTSLTIFLNGQSTAANFDSLSISIFY
jgi:hypothetical protein